MWIKTFSQLTHFLIVVLHFVFSFKVLQAKQPLLGHKQLEWYKHWNTGIPYTLVLYFWNFINASLDWDNSFKEHTTRSGLTGNPNIYLYYIKSASWAAAPCLASLSCYHDVIVKTKAGSGNYSLNLTVVFLPWTNWVDVTCRDNGFFMSWCASSAFDKNLASTQ